MSNKRTKYTFKSLDQCPPEFTGILPSRFDNTIKNQKFNKLTTLYPVKLNNKMYWLCKCDCGNYHITIGKYLKSGHCKSCGCEISKQLREDFTNTIINNNIIIKFAHSSDRGPVWDVRCLMCGQQYQISSEQIRRESVFCPNCSVKNIPKTYKTGIILNELKNSLVPHLQNVKTEFKFPDCKFKLPLPFDFYIPQQVENDFIYSGGFLIEYDGPQHYFPAQWFNKSEIVSQTYKNFISTQVRDWIKDNYCITHNIPLIRIKYSTKRNPSFAEIYNNNYVIVAKANEYDKQFKCFDVIQEDIINNQNCTFLIESGTTCTFKCDKENNCQVCQNISLKNQPIIDISIDKLIEKYANQDLATGVTFQGLEPLDSLKQHLWFIYYFRQQYQDPIYIWTGYTEEECEDLIYLIKEKMHWENIIIKFGRFVPNQESHKDEVLGVTLASPNQYAKKIS